MIPISRPSPAVQDLRIKVVGLGGAGGNVLDRLTLDGLRDVEIVAINTDAQALAGSVAAEKVQLGRNTTRGLGAGGDPEVGYAAAEEGVDDIRKAIEGAQMVFLCVGLGGGTGSGAARIVASVAREQKALVVGFVTLPFGFEGKRRRAQAEEALGALQRYADVVIHYENDRMGDAVSPLAGIQEAFTVSDQTLSQSVRALAAMVRQRGLVRVGFDEVVTALRGSTVDGVHCQFGYGEADGDNRAHEALNRALKCPLMDKGRLLHEARNLLVNVAGGPSMTLNEVQILMEELNRHISDQTRLLFGAAVDPALGQKMSVTMLSAIEMDVRAAAAPAPVSAPSEVRARPAARVETSSPVSVAPTPPPAAPRFPEPAPAREPEPEPEPEPAYFEPEPTYEPEPELESEPERAVAAAAPAPVAVATAVTMPEAVTVETAALFSTITPASTPDSTRAAAAEATRLAKAKFAQAKQEQMQFEPVTRGRFEKSEPTIVDGQDLDVPTFLRRNVKVK